MDIAFYKSPLGWFRFEGSEKGLQRLRFIADERPVNPVTISASLKDAVQQLDEYFHQQRTSFNIKLDWSEATDFNRAVWTALVEIPYGHTTSYSAIAKKVGSPKANQAVGLANKNNPIAIVVPCHRVIAKSGNLHGYFYGLDMKRKLLELENPKSFAQQGKLF